MKNLYSFNKLMNAPRSLFKKAMALGGGLLLMGTVALAQTSNPIGVSGLAGDFEIDADYTANSCTNSNICSGTGADWRTVLKQDPNNPGRVIPGTTDVAGENARWIVDGNSGSGASPSNDEIETFAGTSNKNGDFVTIGASPYSIDTSNPGAPQKNDLTNIYVRSQQVAGKTWLVMGAETRSVDGTSYLDFEYNQAGMAKNATQLFGPISLADKGGRTAKNGTAGDALFVVDFSKGGGVPIPKVFEWRLVTKGNKSTYAWVEIPIPAGKAYIVTNGSDVTAPGVNSAFAGDGSASNTTAALQFVEMGVNLTDLFGNFNPCAPEATMLVKTRTSSSYTSELKDFSLFNFTLVDNADIEDLTDVALCPSQNATFNAVVSGPGASAANVEWYKVITEDDPATPANEEVLSLKLVNGGKITISTNGATSTLLITGVAALDAGKYKAVLTGSTCGAAPKYALCTLNSVDAPVVTLLEPSVCEARAKGLLTVCNPLDGAEYTLEQLDDQNAPKPTLQQIVTFDANTMTELTFELEPGFKFTLKVDNEGCEETVDCDDLATAEECTAAASARVTNPNKPQNDNLGNNSKLRLNQANAIDQTAVAYPVPFSDKVTIEFKSKKAESYVINLYDMHGKMVKQLATGSAQAGEITSIQLEGKGMVDSMYLVRKVSKSGVETIKLLKKE